MKRRKIVRAKRAGGALPGTSAAAAGANPFAGVSLAGAASTSFGGTSIAAAAAQTNPFAQVTLTNTVSHL